ncbi:efflux RND transporter permease subunit, partial [Myxococcota bacterium]|nr:efflux RND transporter permease subunit [Myxococcota bacterium]
MFLRLVTLSIRRRIWVVGISILLTVYGVFAYTEMEVDVFPNLTAPSLTVITEAPGMAPEETELLVTTPLEKSLQGMPRVRRVRSTSSYGYSIIWVDFQWGMNLSRARRVVAEKLQVARASLPDGSGQPVIMPETSIMGEIMTIGLVGKDISALSLRDIADRQVARALLQIPGVAQVFVTGGERGQWKVRVDQTELAFYKLTMDDVAEALRSSGKNRTGGFHVAGIQESMIRVLGQYTDKKSVSDVVVAVREGIPVTVGRIAKVELGAAAKRGEGSVNGKPGIVITILKQPGASTIKLTERIESTLIDVQKGLPRGVTVIHNLFNQARFIKTSIRNVRRSLRDGALLVILVLMLFMMDFRSAFISLTALPLSVMIAVLALYFAGAQINTMTLGGLTLAMGVLIDDAIIGVENAWRRLRENNLLPPELRKGHMEVIVIATGEILHSVVFANILILLVFIPVFFIGGMEGRLIAPLGFAYMAANAASLLVSLTLTPALSALMFSKGKFADKGDGFLLRLLKRMYRPLLRQSIRHPLVLLVIGLIPLTAAAFLALRTPRRFLPEWNEGALNITTIALPGTSLRESDRLGKQVEQVLLSIPEVVSTARRTGRTELDEHAMEVSGSEIEVRLRKSSRSKAQMLRDIRKKLNAVKGVRIQIGQPLSHRIDHMLSGSRSSLVVKIVGMDMYELRTLAKKVAAVMGSVDGLEDVLVERVTLLHQHHVVMNTQAMAAAGLRSHQ